MHSIEEYNSEPIRSREKDKSDVGWCGPLGCAQKSSGIHNNMSKRINGKMAEELWD